MNIPSVPSTDLDIQTKYTRLKLWSEFLTRQKIISCIVNTDDIKNFLTTFDKAEVVAKKNITIIVAFPRSHNHLYDFNNRILNATAYAFFYEDGSVCIEGIGDRRSHGFKSAWDEIALRTTGSDLPSYIPSPPTTSKIDEALKQIEKAKKKLVRNLKRWIKIFNDIPGIQAHTSFSLKNPDKVMNVYYHNNMRYLLDSKRADKQGDGYASLRSDGSIRLNSLNEKEERSSVHEKWLEDIEKTPISEQNLEWLYKQLLELYKQYTELVPNPKTLY